MSGSSSDPFTVLDSKPVVITTSGGAAVSVGKIKVTRFTLGTTGARIDLHFDTEQMSCVLGVPSEKVPRLIQSWNGETYRYQLPAGDHVWLRDTPQPPAIDTNIEATIESFPIPRVDVVPPVGPARSGRK